MKVYLVGGAVRDQLLGRPIKDKDFVVVGATPETMLAEGFLQVGADFPVFLHPISKQEYALARTERKSGHGYQGFSIHASPDVTLEEDLQRRDLSINALAIEVTGLFDDAPVNGEVIDYYGGLDDIKAKVLRHISPAFSEDPLRVLRVARFYSRYFEDGFVVADETLALMRDLVSSGELNHLSAERIWQESARAMMQSAPQVYWQQLYEIGALGDYFAPLQRAWDVAWVRQLCQSALSFAAQMQLTLVQRWALLMSSLNTQMCLPPTQAYAHPLAAPYTDQDAAMSSTMIQKAVDGITSIAQSAKIPKELTQFAKLFIQEYPTLSAIDHLPAAELIDLIQTSGAHKQPEKLTQLLISAQVLSLARQHHRLSLALGSFQAIGIHDIDPSLKGAAIGAALTQARSEHLSQTLALTPSQSSLSAYTTEQGEAHDR